jgi:hypothetical protein
MKGPCTSFTKAMHRAGRPRTINGIRPMKSAGTTVVPDEVGDPLKRLAPKLQKEARTPHEGVRRRRSGNDGATH